MLHFCLTVWNPKYLKPFSCYKYATHSCTVDGTLHLLIWSPPKIEEEKQTQQKKKKKKKAKHLAASVTLFQQESALQISKPPQDKFIGSLQLWQYPASVRLSFILC